MNQAGSGPVRAVDVQALPDELKARTQWVGWREERDHRGARKKVPYSAVTGRRASTTDPTTWGTYDQALAFCRERGLDGVGFVFTPGDPYCGVDLDDCRDPHNGHIEPWALEIIDSLDSYTELSPSGTGVHIIVKGTLPQGGRKRGSIEMYDCSHFFTMTGNAIR